MKRNMKNRLAGLLAATMLLGLLPTVAFAAEAATPEVTTPAAAATRGEACTLLLEAAGDYNKNLKKTDILKGDGTGALHEERSVTRAEALVMLSRAFGPLPTPVGATARSAYPVQTYTDVPAWGQDELAGIFQAGIVTGTDETTFDPKQTVTAAELNVIVRRVYALLGTNLKDDFYATVNKTARDNSAIPAGQPTSGTMYDLVFKAQADVAGLIQEIAAETHKKGTGEQKIADLYNNALNWNARNAAGLAPLEAYLDAIDSAKTIKELMAAHKKVADELGVNLLLGFALGVDMKDSSTYTVAFGTTAPGLPKEEYLGEGGVQKAAYLRYLAAMFTLSGEDAGAAAAAAEAIFALEAPLATAMLSREAQGDVDQIYNMMTMKELKALFVNVDLDAVYAASGLAKADKIFVTDVGLLKAVAALFTEDNLSGMKNYAKATLLQACGAMLMKGFNDAANTFQQEAYGIEGVMPDEQMAAAQVQNLMSEFLGEAYVDKFFSAKAKADVEDMIADFLTIYKERIRKLDWMSAETKKLALKKLETMSVKVGYPDQWDTSMDKVAIRSVVDGGSYFENVIAISKAGRDELVSYQGTKVDKSEWITPAFTVNAFYNATANDITFPAGILQAPMYDVDASREQNLGAIGFIIAHEITHAFDNNGAKFDENGNAANWWTEADYAAFQALCAEAVTYYEGKEAAPGITCNGTLTLSENVADMGAAACVTEAASREKTPDFETLYRSMATTWSSTASRAYMEMLTQMDVHAPDKLRGYLPAQTCDEFYTTFDIQPGDGMYLAPEDRLQIW